MLLPIVEASLSKPTGRGDRFFAYGPKVRRLIGFFSKLEFERWLLLECDPTVVFYCEQPAEVEVWINGRWRKSRLDFWVRTRDGGEIFEEVKYSAELQNPSSRARRQIEIQRIALSAGGRRHRVMTEREICGNMTLLNSARTLLCEFDIHYPSILDVARPLAQVIIDMVRSSPGCSIDSVLGNRPKGVAPEVFRLMVMELIRTHKVDAQLAVRNLGPLSQLRLIHVNEGIV